MAYIGNQPLAGSYSLITLTESFNGSLTDFTMSEAVGNANNLIIILSGVTQRWGVGFTVSGSTLTFTSAPATGETISILKLGDTLSVGVPSDGSVTNAKLGTDISAAKLTAGTVATARLGSGTASSSTYLAGDQTYKALSAYNDDALQNDIATLALHQATNANAAKYNLANSNVDVYQDSTGVATFTDCARDTTGEYVSTISEGTQVNFTSSGTWTRGSVTSLSHILLVAGGGGGGYDAGAGGGAGGLVYTTGYAVSGTNYAVTIGAGGAYSTTPATATNGVDTTFVGATTLTASGGGGGGSTNHGNAGGSGGGGGNNGAYNGGATDQSSESGVSGSNGFGFAGIGGAHGSGKGGGGGGGAGGAPAATWTSSQASNGGAGKDMSSIFGTSVGEDGWFAGGGGGASETNGATSFGNGGSGLKGGGARGGGPATGAPNATAAIANTGGGGGGGKNLATAGGSGFLSLIPLSASATGNYVSTATVANASVSKVGIVITYKNNAGTNTLNTDITAEVSANGGSNYSTATLVAAGTFSTGVLQCVANDVSVTAGTSIQYKISFANQASGSKEVRITGASLIY